MDLADIRNLVLKTQASILENGFLGFNDIKHVSVAIPLLAPGPCCVFLDGFASGLVEISARPLAEMGKTRIVMEESILPLG